jgi:hypothetical protein
MALPTRPQPAQAAVPSQGRIHGRRLEQPAHAFLKTVVAVRKQHATQRLLGN